MSGSGRTAIRALFRVAAGPRTGYGHLVRATVLARACGVEPVLSLRGGQAARRTARQLGCRVAAGTARQLLKAVRPDVVVIDDPSPVAAHRFCRAARRQGLRVASVHDLGLGYCDADLTIDGSIAQPHGTADGCALLGTPYAILEPCGQPAARPRDAGTVLIALGGGPRRQAARRLARMIATRHPQVSIRVAGGFAALRRTAADSRIVWLPPQRGLARELARADVAVVGGGVTLYEACAAGTPAVGVAVVPAQRPTICGFARLGAIRDGGSPSHVRRAAAEVTRLIEQSALRARVAREARALVDGDGARRVAAAVIRLGQHGVPVSDRRTP